eukprot:g20587.t1
MGVRASLEAICRLMSSKAEQASLLQFRDDIKRDVELEKADREFIKSMARAEREQMVKRDLENMERSWRIAQQPAVLANEAGVDFGFIPHSAKRDLSGYYYQYGALASDEHVMDLFLLLAGFWQSEEKRESHSALLRLLVVLGMAYELSIDNRQLRVKIPKEKVERLHRMGREILESFKPRAVNFEKLLSFRGLFRHVAQLNNALSNVVKGLDQWADEDFFGRAIKSRHQRASLKRLVRSLLRGQRMQSDKVLEKQLFEKPFAHVYTDASVERVKELNALLRQGRRTGFDEFQMWIGGILVLPDGTRRTFKVQLTRLPKFINYVHIGILELLAVRVALHMWAAELRRYYSVFHIDNLGNVYVACRNSCTCAEVNVDERSILKPFLWLPPDN